MNLYEYHAKPERLTWYDNCTRRVPWLALRYALKVIKGRWEEGEEAIKSEPREACLYAIDVIKGPWPEGEEIIKTNSTWWRFYCEHFGIDL